MSKFIPINNRYSVLNNNEVKEVISSMIIDYRKDEIQNYNVLLFHRILSINFGPPTEFDWEPWQVLDDNKIRAIKTEWRYFITTKSNTLILISTEIEHAFLKIELISFSNRNSFSDIQRSDCKKFIDDLLNELNRLKKVLIDEDENLTDSIDFQYFFIDNIYLQNYIVAEYYFENSPSLELNIRKEALKYDARDKEVRIDKEKMKYIDKHFLFSGTFITSAILFYFMAFEGFVNLLYYSFLKKEYRENGFCEIIQTNNRKKKKDLHRLDIENKLLNIHQYCYCFGNSSIGKKTTIYKDFVQLKKFRNLIFHSSLKQNIKRIIVSQDEFIYNFDVDEIKDTFLPSRRYNLTINDLKKVKILVDNLIEHLTGILSNKEKKIVKNYFFSDFHIPFVMEDKYKIRLPFENEHIQ
jgi:hypothetical protein